MACQGHDHSGPGPHVHINLTRKRKKPKVDYHGYDPSISVLADDPRLSPPPPWFGVNFHPSQPVSNSWLEWSGADVAMFDISRNQMVPISLESSLQKDKRRKRQHRSDSEDGAMVEVGTPPAPVPPPPWASEGSAGGGGSVSSAAAAAAKMTLFPPARNEWNDSRGMELDGAREPPPAAAGLSSSASSSPAAATASAPVTFPLLVRTATTVTTASTSSGSSSRSGANARRSNSVAGAGAGAGAGVGDSQPGSAAGSLDGPSSEEDPSPMPTRSSSAAAQDAIEGGSARNSNKNLSKLNRMRKSMYQEKLKESIAHLEELIQLVKTLPGSASLSGARGASAAQRALLIAALGGDSTLSPSGEHALCEHARGAAPAPLTVPAASDGFDPAAAKERLEREMRDRANVRRMRVLLEQGEELRASIATTALRLIAVNLDLLAGLAAGLVALQRAAAGDPARLATALRQAIAPLSDAQCAALRTLAAPHELERLHTRVHALRRLVAAAGRALVVPEVRSTNTLLTSLLSDKKQVDKLIMHVVDVHELMDFSPPLQSLLQQLKDGLPFCRPRADQPPASKNR
jgi:hypothetical protein